MVSRIAIVIIAVIVLSTTVACGAWAAGEWYWNVSPDLTTGTRYFTGVAGSLDPLVLQGIVVNNDQQNVLLFNGVTLKTDELDPADHTLYTSLWTTEPSMDLPECLSLPGGQQQSFTIGTFDLASAPVGVYQFRFIGAVGYDGVEANPSQMNSGLVTVEVVPVPEPSSLFGLALPLAGLLAGRRRRRV